jgi:hypothetical protein
MFVQIIEGQVADGDGLRKQMDRWMSDLRPGADGFLGTTAGITDDGRAICFARFTSADAATANSARPEQDAWWRETARCFDGDVTFTDSDEVEEFLGGGSDDAGFVQVMKSAGLDRDQVRTMDAAFEQHAGDFRPDLIGVLRLWTGADSTVEVAYFTSEADARVGEKQEPPAELAAMMGEFESMMANTEFIDLRDPWLY